MILGLDISTSTIGYALLDDKKKFLKSGYLKLDKLKNEYDKLQKFIEFLDSLNVYLVKNIEFYVEQPVLAYSAGGSRAGVISKLARFNGMCCSIIYMKFDKQPILLNASSARKNVGMKVPRKSDTKEFVLQHHIKSGIFDANRLEYKRTGKMREQMYDISDAITIALAGFYASSRKS